MKLHSAPLSLLLLCSIHTTHARVGTSAISVDKEEDVGKPRYAEITSNFNNECLRTSYTQNGQNKAISYEVKIVPCTDDSDELWDYDSEKYIMKHVLSGYCLDGREEVKITKCEDSTNSKSKTQRWWVDDEKRLVNYNPIVRPMLCMKINTGSENLSLKACDDELNSKFTLTKPNSRPWKGMIVNDLKNKCVQSSSKNEVYVDVCRNSNDKYWSYDFKTLLIKNQATGRCMAAISTSSESSALSSSRSVIDKHASDYSIDMSVCRKNDDNQKWIQDNKGKLVNGKHDICIQVRKATNKLVLKNCRNIDGQRFKMVSVNGFAYSSPF